MGCNQAPNENGTDCNQFRFLTTQLGLEPNQMTNSNISTGQTYLNPKSANRKTGPIPVSTTSEANCPNACPFMDSGCYAKGFPLRGRWQEVTDGARGTKYSAFIHLIHALPDGQLWRHNQAGDLIGNRKTIDAGALNSLASANAGKRGFTYTHYDVIKNKANRSAVAKANANGFTVNLSANNLDHADALVKTNAGPVVVVMPRDFTGKTTTPDGHKVIQCPATVIGNDTTCADCALCQKQNGRAIVGFPAHGNARKRAENISMGAA
jgi:hypothetical protein